MMLSVIVPVDQQASGITGLKRRIHMLRSALPYAVEVVLVDAGASAELLRHAEALGFVVVRPGLCRYGQAVRIGMLTATGVYRLLIEPGWSMPPEQVQLLLPPVLTGFDIAVASRYLPGSERYGEPRLVHLLSRVFNRFVQGLVLPGVVDPQCAFKVFRADAARAVFSRTLEVGRGIDVEALAVASSLNLRVAEVPIDWHFRNGGRPRLWVDGPDLVASVVRIRTRLSAGVYPPLGDFRPPVEKPIFPFV